MTELLVDLFITIFVVMIPYNIVIKLECVYYTIDTVFWHSSNIILVIHV